MLLSILRKFVKLATIVSPPNTTVVGNGYNLAFTGNVIANLSQSLVDVFKQYAVLGIKLMYLPAYNNYPLVAGTAIIPKIYYAEDKAAFQPDTVAGNVDRMLQQDNLRILDSSKKWTAYISRPRPFTETAINGTTTLTPVAPPSKQVQWFTTDELQGTSGSGMLTNFIHSHFVVEPNNSAVAVTTGTIWARILRL